MAQKLLGKTLVHLIDGERLSGRIVETEAYLGVHDKAAHSFGDRRTKRTESMYLAGGHAYVFLIYGMYACFNVVTGSVGVPEAVLIRALEPAEGAAEMARRRQQSKKSPLDKSPPSITVKMQKINFALTNGPGKLCQALGIDRRLDQASLTTSSELWIEDTPLLEDEQIYVSPRVGIDYAEEAIHWPLRFSLMHPEHGHRFVSKPWPKLLMT